MIQVRLGPTDPKTVTISRDMTAKQVFAQEGRSIETGQTYLDGSPLSAAEMNTPLGNILQEADSCNLFQVINTKNA